MNADVMTPEAPSLIQACLGFLGSTAVLTATMALLAAL
jgi:hypothetical protein